MTSSSKMVSPSKKMSINSLVSTKKISPTKTSTEKTVKDSEDATLLCRMFDSNAYSTDTKGNGFSRSGTQKGMTYLGKYCFADVGCNIGGVIFYKTTPRFVLDSTVNYESERSFLLLNNTDAKDISMDKLKDFITKSSLALRSYQVGHFICGDFASKLHNKAEASGIRCGFVVSSEINGITHAFNVFCGINKNGTRSVVFADMTSKIKSPFITESEFIRKESKRITEMYILV